MHRAARQSGIMKALASEGSCTVAELTRTLRVSDETIRRDIKAMAERGLVERVHGGVLLPELMREPDFRERMRQQAEEKRAIARLVAARITDGDSLMIDSGSTNLYVARVLETRRDLLAVTNNAEIARMLGAGRGNRVYLGARTTAPSSAWTRSRSSSSSGRGRRSCRSAPSMPPTASWTSAWRRRSSPRR